MRLVRWGRVSRDAQGVLLRGTALGRGWALGSPEGAASGWGSQPGPEASGLSRRVSRCVRAHFRASSPGRCFHLRVRTRRHRASGCWRGEPRAM